MNVTSVKNNFPVLLTSSFREELKEKISIVARRCFEILKTIFTIPMRYVGSKSWSIPGVILRFPYLVIKHLFKLASSSSFVKELFCTEGHQFMANKTISSEELVPYLPHASAAAFVFRTKPEYLLDGWSVVSPKSFEFHDERIQAQDQCFFDPKSGLKVSVVENGDESIIAFDAINTPGLEWKKNLGLVSVVLGGNPAVFDQGVTFFDKLYKSSYFKNKKVSLAGVCYGGAIASYIALQRKIQTVSYNTFPLGGGQQLRLGVKRLQEAKKYITNISADSDFVSDPKPLLILDQFLNFLGLRTPGVFGRRMRISSAYPGRPIENHDYVLGSVMKHLGKDRRTLPKNLSPNELPPLRNRG